MVKRSCINDNNIIYTNIRSYININQYTKKIYNKNHYTY